MDLIRAEGLSRRFGAVEALSGLTVSVGKGECMGLLGHNGAGKTTAIKLLLGLIKPTGGRAEVLGRPAGDPAVRGRVGYSPETPHFYPFLTARETLHFFRKLSGLAPSAVDVEGILADVGLCDHANARVGSFSKGQVQRLAVAQALVGDPEILFLDEPSSGLDPAGRVEMRSLIGGLKRRGKTILLNTHILADVEQVADRVMILKQGRLAELYDQRATADSVGVLARVDSVTDSVLDDLRAMGLHLSYHEGRLALAGLTPGQEPAVVARLVEGGAQVYAFTPQRVSLEQRFMAIMGGGHRDGARA